MSAWEGIELGRLERWVEPVESPPLTRDVLIEAANKVYEMSRRVPARYLLCSPWEADFIDGVEAGKGLYLARLRADLNERRRRGLA